MSIVDYLDSPRMQVVVLAAVAALIAALAVYGLVDLDDSRTNEPAVTVSP